MQYGRDFRAEDAGLPFGYGPIATPFEAQGEQGRKNLALGPNLESKTFRAVVYCRRGFPMANDIPEDLQEKAAIMREFGRLRAAGQPVPAELQAKHVKATNDRYTTGPEPGERVPDFRLPDQDGVPRSVANLAGPNGLLLVFHRSADW
jgi:hypothetical protein